VRRLGHDQGNGDFGHSTGTWRKSARSWANSDCVEIGQGADGVVAVRDSVSPRGPVLEFDSGKWNAFLADVRVGRFSL
jgi:hypothetical protein